MLLISYLREQWNILARIQMASKRLKSKQWIGAIRLKRPGSYIIRGYSQRDITEADIVLYPSHCLGRPLQTGLQLPILSLNYLPVANLSFGPLSLCHIGRLIQSSGVVLPTLFRGYLAPSTSTHISYIHRRQVRRTTQRFITK